MIKSQVRGAKMKSISYILVLILFARFVSASECGALTESTMLDSDVYSDVGCFIIDNDNIVLDCNGYSIYFAQGQLNGSEGITVIGKNNISVKNCSIYTNNNSLENTAIYAKNVNDLTIKDSTSGISSGESTHIYLEDVNNFTIKGNRFKSIGAATQYPGRQIAIESSSGGKIEYNYMQTVYAFTQKYQDMLDLLIGTDPLDGEQYSDYASISSNVSTDIWIMNNEISTDRPYSFGIKVTESGLTSIENNTIYSGKDSLIYVHDGMYLLGEKFSIKNNYLDMHGDYYSGMIVGGMGGYGTFNDSVIEKNTIKINATDTGDCRGLVVSSSNSAISENKVISENPADSLISYWILYSAKDNIFTNNEADVIENSYIETVLDSSYGLYNVWMYEIPEYGKLYWTEDQLETLSPLIMGETIIIRQNFIGYIGENPYWFNVNPKIEMYGLTYSEQPILIKNAETRCDNGNGCVITAYEDRTLWADLDTAGMYSVHENKLTLLPGGAEVYVNDTLQLVVGSGSKNYSWSVLEGSDFCQVDGNGLVTGIAIGECKVNAYDINWDISGSINLTVSYAPASCGGITGSYTLTNDVASDGTCFEVLDSDVVLDCAGYKVTYGTSQAGYGVLSNGKGGLTVKNCNFETPQNGISGKHAVKLTSSSNSIVSNNNMTLGSQGSFAIYLENSSNAVASWNTLDGNGFSGSKGAYASVSNGFQMTGNSISNAASGILISNSNSTRMTNNGISNSSQYGISLQGSNNAILGGNQIIKSGFFGIAVSSSTNSSINGGKITLSSQDGINIINSYGINVSNVNSSGNTQTGILVQGSARTRVDSCTVENNSDGITVSASANTTLMNNIARSNSVRGIKIFQGSEGIVAGNNLAQGNRFGMYVYSASQGTLSGNTVCGNSETDFSCSPTSNGFNGSSNRLNSLEKCNGGWPAYGSGYVNCNGDACYDDDGGINPEVKGRIFALGFDGIYDVCIGANPTDLIKGLESNVSTPQGQPTTLQEYYCERKTPLFSYISCTGGCVDGHCLQSGKYQSCSEIKDDYECKTTPACELVAPGVCNGDIK